MLFFCSTLLKIIINSYILFCCQDDAADWLICFYVSAGVSVTSGLVFTLFGTCRNILPKCDLQAAVSPTQPHVEMLPHAAVTGNSLHDSNSIVYCASSRSLPNDYLEGAPPNYVDNDCTVSGNAVRHNSVSQVNFLTGHAVTEQCERLVTGSSVVSVV